MKPTLLLALALAVCPVVPVAAQPRITIKLGDNLPDRTNTWGAVVEQINAEFKAANPGVEIVTESYPDQPYQQKVKIYATARQLPDVLKFWSVPSLLKPLVTGGFIEPLNRSDFEKLDYLPGALDSNVYGGKLYGIPVSADLWVIYYNKKIFKDAGIERPPATLDELVALAPRLKARGLIPMVTDGKDAWPLCITFDQLAWRISGDATLPARALARKARFTDPVFVQAARELSRMIKAGLFQDDLMVSDYGAARNLFGQGRAAMYLMGSWELGLGTDRTFSESFRTHVDVFRFPLVAGGKGTEHDVFAWFGGNYVVSASSKHKVLGMKYLQFYARRFPVLAWERQATLPAQKVAARPGDTPVARSLLRIVSEAKATSGTPSLDLSTPRFKDDIENAMRELASGLISPEDFTRKLDTAADKAARR